MIQPVMGNKIISPKIFLAVMLMGFLSIHALIAQVANMTSKMAPSGLGYLEYLPSDYQTSGKKYPLMIFLHGLGERGNGTTDLYKVATHGPPKHIKNGHKMTFTVDGVAQTFIVISPQLSTSQGNWYTSIVDGIVNYAISNYRVDTCKVYLTGLSLGGNGTWNYAYSSNNSKNKFAAIASIAGWGSSTYGCTISSRKIPVWAFHGDADKTIGISRQQAMIDAINNCTNPVANPKALFSIYPGVGHNSWDRAYSTDHTYHNPNLYEWFLQNSKCTVTNKAPLANAGLDKTITLPSNSAVINGSGTDSDGTITSYSWTKISGSTTTLSNSNSINLSVSNLLAGTYVFRLTVTDNKGAKGNDDVKITVVNPQTTQVTSNGNGLAAIYYDNIDFTGATISRIDTSINFNWGYGSPSSRIGTNTFSARWSGEIQAPSTGTYTFYASSDDGTRLYINNQLVIDNWFNGNNQKSGIITLSGGQKYPIRYEYYEDGGGSKCQLYWSSTTITKTIIAKKFLYSTTPASISSTSLNREMETTEESATLLAYPNPANENIEIIFSSQTEGMAKISICDMTSKVLFNKDINLNLGQNKIPVSLNDFHNGIYIINIENAGKKLTNRFQVLK